ncbi:hypothetical protein [Catenulispora pinisilvae]|uniref:hypothetical protein n=1 Tax=Catenulispora pinisilvae TaxID=2705253 RepID=UPI001890FC86|nr:hypothetical protein [Catenulispora pinisilvae]
MGRGWTTGFAGVRITDWRTTGAAGASAEDGAAAGASASSTLRWTGVVSGKFMAGSSSDAGVPVRAIARATRRPPGASVRTWRRGSRWKEGFCHVARRAPKSDSETPVAVGRLTPRIAGTAAHSRRCTLTAPPPPPTPALPAAAAEPAAPPLTLRAEPSESGPVPAEAAAPPPDPAGHGIELITRPYL